MYTTRKKKAGATFDPWGNNKIKKFPIGKKIHMENQ